MIGVTIGTHAHADLAEEAARSFRATTGLPAQVIGDVVEEVDCFLPHLLKTRIFDFVDADVNRIVYFDADIFFMRPWDPQVVPEGYLGVVRDLNYAPHILRDAYNIWNGTGSGYFNSGLMIMDRVTHEPMLRMAEQLAVQLTYPCSHFVDQPALNLSSRLLRCPLHYLPRSHNWAGGAGSSLRAGVPVIGAHKFQACQRVSQQLNQASEFRVISEDIDSVEIAYAPYAGYWLYERTGCAKRLVEFREDGTIGYGSAWMEQHWMPVRTVTGVQLLILGFKESSDVLTARVSEVSDGVFDGAWLHFEKMPVRLTKVNHEDHPTTDYTALSALFAAEMPGPCRGLVIGDKNGSRTRELVRACPDHELVVAPGTQALPGIMEVQRALASADQGIHIIGNIADVTAHYKTSKFDYILFFGFPSGGPKTREWVSYVSSGGMIIGSSKDVPNLPGTGSIYRQEPLWWARTS